MRELIEGRLWTGNAAEGRDVAALHQESIRAVVDVSLEEPPALLPREIVYLRVPLTDGAGNSPSDLRLAVKCVADRLRVGQPTLVCCSAGMSRSPTIAAIAAACVNGLSPEASAGRLLGSGPSDVSAALWRAAVEACQEVLAPRG